MRRIVLLPTLFFAAFLLFAGEAIRAGETPVLSKGQTIYVPAYSHIYIGNQERPFLLTVTLSIRNTDGRQPVTVTSADDYDTKGKLIKKYLERPVTLGPWESIRYVVPQKDTSGGSGANFVVDWKAGNPVNPLMVETIMIGAEFQQGISFTSRGQTVRTTE